MGNNINNYQSVDPEKSRQGQDKGADLSAGALAKADKTELVWPGKRKEVERVTERVDLTFYSITPKMQLGS